MRTRCYPSDLTDTQWALVAPHIPAAKFGGRPRTTDAIPALADRARLLPGLAYGWCLCVAAPRTVSADSPGSRSEAKAADDSLQQRGRRHRVVHVRPG
jgi:transposase